MQSPLPQPVNSGSFTKKLAKKKNLACNIPPERVYSCRTLCDTMVDVVQR